MGQTPSEQLHYHLTQLRTTLGEEHPDTLAAWRDYTTALIAEADYATAQPELRHLVAACEWAFGPEHPTTRKNRADWALCLKETHLYFMAFEQYLLVADHDDGYDVRFAAVGCLIRLGCIDEATYLLRVVVRGYAAALGEYHEITRLARGTLVFLLAGVHQQEALVEYGHLWGVDKQPTHRPLGILAETRLLLTTIAADNPRYVTETFNPATTLPVRDPEFFRFVERVNHYEDHYPNPFRRLAPTLEAPTDPHDVPRWRAYCAGLAEADRRDEAVAEYLKLIDYVSERYGLQSDLFLQVVAELRQSSSDHDASVVEYVNELCQLRTEEINRVNDQLDQVRRIRDWSEGIAAARQRWDIHQDLSGPGAPESLIYGWVYMQFIAMSKKYDPALTSRHVRDLLTWFFRIYGYANPRSRSRYRNYLGYLAHNGYVEETVLLLESALRNYHVPPEDQHDDISLRIRCCSVLRNHGWLDVAEQEYQALLADCIVARNKKLGRYRYKKNPLMIIIHDNYVQVLYWLGRREQAYDEAQRMWRLAETTWDHDSVDIELARVIHARQLLLLGKPDEARQHARMLMGAYETDASVKDQVDRWFRRWSQGGYLAPINMDDNYIILADNYSFLLADMVAAWGCHDAAVIYAFYNSARYTRDAHVDDNRALGQIEAALAASNQLYGADDLLTLNIRRDHAELLVMTGSQQQGLLLASELVTTCENLWGLRHPMTVVQWASYLYCLLLAEEYQQVAAKVRWVITVCAYELGYDHPVIMKLRYAAAVAYDHLGEYEKACDQWQCLHDALEKLYGYGSSHWVFPWVEKQHAASQQRLAGHDDSA